MGASGSGKTTLLNMLSTLDKPTSGQVFVNGQDVTQLKKNKLADFRGREIGFIFQDFNLVRKPDQPGKHRPTASFAKYENQSYC